MAVSLRQTGHNVAHDHPHLVHCLRSGDCRGSASLRTIGALSSKVETEQVEETTASINDAQELHILDAKVGLYYMQMAMNTGAHLNKIAATWSGVAAGLGHSLRCLAPFSYCLRPFVLSLYRRHDHNFHSLAEGRCGQINPRPAHWAGVRSGQVGSQDC